MGMVVIDFRGDALLAQQDERGIWVSLRRMCDSIGLDFSSQLSRLKTESWAVMVQTATTGADGKSYQMVMLHVDAVPMWLATISASRVAPAAVEKLERYQRECARVLRDHFMPARAAAPMPFDPSAPDVIIAVIEAQSAKLRALQSMLTEQTEVIAELAPKAEYFDAFMNGASLCLPSAAGRALGVSFRKMLGELRERKILSYDHAGDLIAKAQWSVATGAGYFDHKIGTRPDGEGGRVARTQLYVTKLGFEWLGNEIIAGRLSGANEAQPRSPRKPRAKKAA